MLIPDNETGAHIALRGAGLRHSRAIVQIADKSKTYPVYGLDIGLLAAIVTERFAGVLDAARDRRFRDNPAIPDMFDDLIL